ncbi:MAG: CyaY protein [Gammaproteobacteria bacterium]|jgi:CyaY protein
MNESQFNKLAEDTLVEIEDAVESSDVDIDYDNIGNILTLEFLNRSQIIINKQAPLMQIWVAARSGGYHFSYDEIRDCWHLSSQADQELFACLSRYCTEQAGETVLLER